MAHYNVAEANRLEAQAKNYTELKKYITSVDENQKLSDWFLASEHIKDMESRLVEQSKQLDEYRAFFSMLQKLLPVSLFEKKY